MIRKTIEFEIGDDSGRIIRLTIGRANVEMGLRRFALAQEQDDFVRANIKGMTTEEVYARLSLYPPMIASVIKAEGITWPMTFEQFFREAPEVAVNDWDDAVRQINPHWYPRPVKDGKEAGEGEGQTADAPKGQAIPSPAETPTS